MIEYFNEDCMVGMARYPDKHFDLAIVDPPYGIGMGGGLVGNSKIDYKQFAGGDQAPPEKEYFQELFRISKNQIIWGANHFIEQFNKNSSCWVVWDKVQPENFTMAMCELAWTSFNKPAKIYKKRIVGADDYRIHPTQKPVALYKWLLTNYAKPGDKILDTHVGSASSLIACYDLGFDAVGFELDEEYYRISRERLENHMKQLRFSDMWEDEKC
jgi:site-specific DNA-methyltransferase (adenine-specific)